MVNIMRAALIVDGVVDTISTAILPDKDWVEVRDYVFAGFVLQKDGSFIAPVPTVEEAADALTAKRSAASMTRAAFAIGAANAGWITETEAEDWGAGVALPPIAADAIATLPEADRFVMRMSVRTRQRIWRTDTLVLILMAAQKPKVTAKQMDTFFGVG